MTTLNVPEMHCNNCVKRITNALNAAELKFEVSLENKTVSVEGCEDCVKKAIEELSDLGFSAEVAGNCCCEEPKADSCCAPKEEKKGGCGCGC